MQTDFGSLADAKRSLELEHGEWTSHNIHLGGDIYTLGADLFGTEVKVRRILQIVADIAPRPLEELRILDLACLEGLYGIECARHGARVVGIEGRPANAAKARFAGEALGLSNYEVHVDDVRNATRGRYGEFDIVLCLGILYHLDEPGLFGLVEQMAEMCRHAVIIDTRISMHAEKPYRFRDHAYWGREVVEHAPDETDEQKQKRLWSSLNNPVSVKLTRRSLYTLLWRSGFTSVFECHVPQEPRKPADRITLAAIRGRSLILHSCPQLPSDRERALPERPNRIIPALRRLRKMIGRLFPESVHLFVRRMAGMRAVDFNRPTVRGQRRR